MDVLVANREIAATPTLLGTSLRSYKFNPNITSEERSAELKDFSSLRNVITARQEILSRHPIALYYLDAATTRFGFRSQEQRDLTFENEIRPAPAVWLAHERCAETLKEYEALRTDLLGKVDIVSRERAFGFLVKQEALLRSIPLSDSFFEGVELCLNSRSSPLSEPFRSADMAIRRDLRSNDERFDPLVITILERKVNLARSLAAKMTNLGVEWPDLEQIAMSALARAARRFHPELGVQFSTFAHEVVYHDLARALHYQSRLIRLSWRQHQKLKAVLDRIPFAEDLSLDDREAHIKHELEMAGQLGVLPLSDDTKDENGMMLAERVADPKVLHPAQAVYLEDLAAGVTDLLKELPRQRRRIVELYFGLNGSDSHNTSEEVGKVLGISGAWVRIEYQAAIKYLQKRAKERMLDW